MALEPGGYADKLGNRYEGRWVVKQLLRLMNEEINSVTIEAVGDDEQGVDLLVSDKNGVQQFQQCKARNASKEFWDISDLNNRGILRNMQFQLDRNSSNEFALVTGVPASVFGDICESARNSNGNPEDFYLYQIKEVGETRRKTFRHFCEYLGLNQEQVQDRAKAFGYLRKTFILLWPDDQNSRDELLGWAGMLINGEPDIVIGTLAEFAQNNIRKTLTAKDILTYLAKLGLHPRELSHDTRIAPAIEELQKKFEESIHPILIGGELIPRNETQEILNALDKGKIIILHGAAGIGKSGVLYELAQILKKQGQPHLPVRLDRQQPKNTPRQFGNDIGLPDSPVSCLASLITGVPGVLIIDQLDALRWTSSHSANSLEVCKAMVRETHRFQMMGKHISVIVSCRTFDLEHDPEIKNWLSGQQSKDEQYQKVEVKKLPPETVKKVVEKSGSVFGRLSEKVKQILSFPQHLAMWVKLNKSARMQDFQSATQLMREFWKQQYRELESLYVNSKEADSVLDGIVNYMEQNSKLFAPASLILHQQRVQTALCTQEIIRIDDNRVSFCHQSYLDFRIADCLLRDIHQKQGNICTWLGVKENQSLFRREQLRQVLVLLSDEAPDEFVKNIRALLFNTDIRFHLKHLSLSVLGQIEQPNKGMLDFSAELLNDKDWRDHAIELIYLGRVAYTQSLAERGIIHKWLESSNNEDVNRALWLLRSIKETSGDLLAEVLSPYLDKGDDWHEKILNTLWFSVEKDSNKLFELRIELARRGFVHDFINWKSLAATSPLRAIRIIEAAISTWDSPRMEDNTLAKKRQRARFEHWVADDAESLKQVVHKYPIFTWDMLMPHIERLTAIKLDKYDTQLDDWLQKRMHRYDNGYMTLPRGITLLVSEAGQELAKTKTKEFLGRTRCLQNSISPITQEILMATYAVLPPEFSNEGIKWLLSDHSRLAIGSGYSEPEWMPADRLIRTLSPNCSEQLFEQLEDTIIHYHSPDERRMAEYHLPTWKKGYFGDYWGRAQHFLLPALCQRRRSKETEGLIGVLKRKFDGYPEHWFLSGGHFTGGWIGSPLPKDRLHKISDRAWLGIINNKNIPKEDHFRLKQVGPETAAESSIEHFSDDLRTVASRYPERFGQLALRFPEDVHPSYLAAILHGVKTTKPENMTDEEKAEWEPAKIETIEAILERFQFGDDNNTATNFCWLIRERPDENWSDRAINKLLEYAKFHQDPKLGKLNMYPSSEGDDANKASVHTLLDNALNCVRGVSGLAIGALLWEHPDWLEKLRPGIESLIKDPHPVVRVAAIEACLPVLNIKKDLAVDWFVTACQDDIRVAASHYAAYYFNSCIKSHFEKLSSIIICMLNSEYDEVTKEGASEICARWLFFDMFKEELERCKTGNNAQRKGIAKIASQFLKEEKFAGKCRELLSPLLNDNEREVRAKANRAFFHKPDILNMPDIKNFLMEYTKSKAFGDDPTGFLYTLEDYPGLLLPHSDIIFSICEAFASSLAESSRDLATGIAYDTSKICPLILRLYEQSQDNHPEIRDHCLDAWDIMFEHRVGVVSELMAQLDR